MQLCKQDIVAVEVLAQMLASFMLVFSIKDKNEHNWKCSKIYKNKSET
jgi:hypothetical protein